MLYLEDYLELIEHLPQELRDRFTDIREKDLEINNSTDKLTSFFVKAKELKPEQRQCEYEKLLEDYQKSMAFADEKVEIANNLYDIMQKLIQRLDNELEKFKLELEADHSGITEELEKRSLQLDSSSNFDTLINNHLNNSTASITTVASTNGLALKISSGIKDRRKSAHRHHPYNNNNQDEHDSQLHGRAKLSNHDHNNTNQYHLNRLSQNQSIINGRQKSSSSPTQLHNNHFINGSPYSSSSINDTSMNVGGDINRNVINSTNELTRGGGHYQNNLSSFGNNTSFKNSSSLHPHHKSNLQNISTNLSNNSSFNYNHQHSALNANLAAANNPNINSVSALAMMYAASVQNHKISGNTTLYHRDETKYCLCRQISYGEMVACDNNECEFEWFHYDCVNITRPPKGKWYCPDCLIKMSGQNHNQQQQNQSQITQNKRAD